MYIFAISFTTEHVVVMIDVADGRVSDYVVDSLESRMAASSGYNTNLTSLSQQQASRSNSLVTSLSGNILTLDVSKRLNHWNYFDKIHTQYIFWVYISVKTYLKKSLKVNPMFWQKETKISFSILQKTAGSYS